MGADAAKDSRLPTAGSSEANTTVAFLSDQRNGEFCTFFWKLAGGSGTAVKVSK